MPFDWNESNLRIANNIIAILTCCGYDLVRLVDNRLQPWKKIACNWPSFEYLLEVTWVLYEGRIIGTRHESEPKKENRRHLFIIDTQTGAIENRKLAPEHEYVRFIAFIHVCYYCFRSQSRVFFSF